VPSTFRILAWKGGVARKVWFLPATPTLEKATEAALSIVGKLAKKGAVPIIQETMPDESTAWHNVVPWDTKNPARLGGWRGSDMR
jgi:hypothetical protein